MLSKALVVAQVVDDLRNDDEEGGEGQAQPQQIQQVRRNIRIGRQNPQYYEVLEGLEPGERVVTSGYEAFKDNEVLIIKK